MQGEKYHAYLYRTDESSSVESWGFTRWEVLRKLAEKMENSYEENLRKGHPENNL